MVTPSGARTSCCADAVIAMRPASSATERRRGLGWIMDGIVQFLIGSRQCARAETDAIPRAQDASSPKTFEKSCGPQLATKLQGRRAERSPMRIKVHGG